MNILTGTDYVSTAQDECDEAARLRMVANRNRNVTRYLSREHGKRLRDYART